MRKIVIANWKMNPQSQKEAEVLFRMIAKGKNFKKVDVVVCPPILYIEKLKKISSKIVLGAQNVFYEKKGPFTGEISAPMLEGMGVKYVIVGHSERRAKGETNLDINKKIKSALSSGLIPIVCVGEIIRDGNHEYFNVIKTQIEESLSGLNKSVLPKLIIAYEPVWALSTTLPRKDATPLDSQEMSIFIKKIISDKFGIKTAMPRIIYGGSVDDKNCGEFFKNGGVVGALVGGASLNADKFLRIINIAENK